MQDFMEKLHEKSTVRQKQNSCPTGKLAHNFYKNYAIVIFLNRCVSNVEY